MKEAMVFTESAIEGRYGRYIVAKENCASRRICW